VGVAGILPAVLTPHGWKPAGNRQDACATPRVNRCAQQRMRLQSAARQTSVRAFCE